MSPTTSGTKRQNSSKDGLQCRSWTLLFGHGLTKVVNPLLPLRAGQKNFPSDKSPCFCGLYGFYKTLPSVWHARCSCFSKRRYPRAGRSGKGLGRSMVVFNNLNTALQKKPPSVAAPVARAHRTWAARLPDTHSSQGPPLRPPSRGGSLPPPIWPARWPTRWSAPQPSTRPALRRCQWQPPLSGSQSKAVSGPFSGAAGVPMPFFIPDSRRGPRSLVRCSGGAPRAVERRQTGTLGRSLGFGAVWAIEAVFAQFYRRIYERSRCSLEVFY